MIEASKEFMAVVEFQILPSWFELDSRTQRDYVKQLGLLLDKYSNVQSRWFDADAWTSELSDFIICEFEDLSSYNDLWSEMRRHPFLATPYAKIGNVLMGMELNIEGLASLAIKSFDDDGELEPGGLKKPQKPKRGTRPARLSKVSKPEREYLSVRSQERIEGASSCRYCGHRLRPRAKYCSRCGTARDRKSST